MRFSTPHKPAGGPLTIQIPYFLFHFIPKNSLYLIRKKRRNKGGIFWEKKELKEIIWGDGS